MQSSQNKVTSGDIDTLFVGHEASRSGAPIVLLDLLRWLTANRTIQCNVIIKDGGDLLPEYAKLAPTLLFNNESLRTRRAGQRMLGFARYEAVFDRIRGGKLRRALHTSRYTLVYTNTIGCGRVLDAVGPINAPVICHIHEMEQIIRSAGRDFERIERYRPHYIAVSQPVRDNLVENHRIPVDRISLVHAFVRTQAVSLDRAAAKEMVRKELGIPQDALIVGGSGALGWRKGTDLFVQLGNVIRSRAAGRSIHLVWVGGGYDDQREQIRHDVRAGDLESTVHFIGIRKNPRDYFQAMDVFVLPSREDPFPLVCLEAASAGLPVVCFDKAGGMPEFVGNDCGYVVPYLDVNAMAERLLHLLDNPAERNAMGVAAQARVRSNHDVEVAAPKILEIMSRVRGNAVS